MIEPYGGIERIQTQIRSAGSSISAGRNAIRRAFWGFVIADLASLLLAMLSWITNAPIVAAAFAIVFVVLLLCLILAFPFLFPTLFIRRFLLQRRLRSTLSGRPREVLESALLPLRNDPEPDTRKIAEGLITRLCPGPPTEIIPAQAVEGTGGELTASRS